MIKDGKEQFYRKLRLGKELNEVIRFFRQIKRKMIKESEKRHK